MGGETPLTKKERGKKASETAFRYVKLLATHQNPDSRSSRTGKLDLCVLPCAKRPIRAPHNHITQQQAVTETFIEGKHTVTVHSSQSVEVAAS